MTLRLIEYGTKEYTLMIHLRYEILRRPIGLSFDKEELEKEKEDLLLGAYEEGRILGCCILTKMDDQTVRLRQMAVPGDLQGKGIGRSLMQFAENTARGLGYHKLIMHARKTATGFYEKSGYAISGNEFEEVGIPHVVMEKNL